MSRPALFLDRDGVINIDHGYVSRPEQFEFVEGIFDVVAAANQAGYMAIVITNQAGIGRGYYTETDFHQLTDWMQKQFSLRGARIDAVYYCPYHPEYGVGEYRKDSEFRKPGPGMLLQAQREHDIDMQRSILVGDKPSDIQAGINAGVGTLLHLEAEDDEALGVRIHRITEALQYFS